jgi:hypothetical protein
MRTRLTRSGRTRAAAAVLCGIGTIATAACTAQASGTTAAVRQPAAVTVAATSVPVVLDCAVHGQTRPGQYHLACAGAGGGYLSGLHWASWGPAAAFADGFSTVNDCVPSCVGGHGHSFPVLVALWRAEPRPGHSGQRYFTRLTVIYTGSRAYSAGGTTHHLPATATYPLSPFGGA